MKQTIIFDLDGTLVDSCGICVGILETMLIERQIEPVINREHARSFMSRGGALMVNALLGDGAGDLEQDLLEFRARYQEVVTPVSALYEGVAEGLADLSAHGFTLAICSNKPQTLCEKALTDSGIAQFFPVVVGSRAGLAPKPAPDLLRQTLSSLGARPGQCAYVGDSELDFQVASDANMPFYFLTYGYAEAGWTPSQSAVFDHFTSLTSELRRSYEILAA
jgi:phosphoglycolate phosphatase